ncbi:MAG: M23 family metallopeptidase, partial [Candidatus Delongbacteria bacterium]|nr:M23 family metallopeptidase [Candidatus Delongbacteria bacterium]
KNALEMFERECLETIAYVIAPIGKIKPNKPVIHLKENITGQTFVLTGGQMIYSPGGGDFDITSASRYIRVERTSSFQKIKTDLPVLIDCRGREQYFINDPLTKSGIKEFQFNYGTFVSNIPLNTINRSDIFYELREFTGTLPHNGNILVQKGDTVKAGELIGKNESITQEYFYVDYNHLLNAQKDYPVADIKRRMKVKIGQYVKTGDVLFRGISYEKGKDPVEKDFLAQRSGTVAGIYYDVGLIAFEILEQNQKVELEAAKFFDQKNKYVSLYLDVHEGETVRENHIIGMKIGRYPKILKSPIKGIIKKIDKTNGTVVIENVVIPYLLKAFVSGEVVSVEDGKSVTVASKCAVIQGATGFGGETYGDVYYIDNLRRFINDLKSSTDNSMNLESKILVFHDSINLETLELAVKLKVSGMIAPSINNKDWVLFCKNELNVAFTGDEHFGFSLVLIKGFGNVNLEDDVSSLLKSYQDREISITGRTQIRAGIIRPQMILPA